MAGGLLPCVLRNGNIGNPCTPYTVTISCGELGNARHYAVDYLGFVQSVLIAHCIVSYL